ncbi:uncharacterized protein BROUX77_003368 [Berkeleyomyces rouxiae]|uniref:uncharacterized protein n=1 Tax=Berkeleyomyces rouxiae TaxID=2035830 RepID=UPI003B7DB1FF
MGAAASTTASHGIRRLPKTRSPGATNPVQSSPSVARETEKQPSESSSTLSDRLYEIGIVKTPASRHLENVLSIDPALLNRHASISSKTSNIIQATAKRRFEIQAEVQKQSSAKAAVQRWLTADEVVHSLAAQDTLTNEQSIKLGASHIQPL